VPFRFTELLVVSIVVLGVGAIALLAMNVPVVGREARREKELSLARSSRPRSNPRLRSARR